MTLKNWWKSQTTKYKALVVAGISFIIVGAWLPSAAWFASWPVFSGDGSVNYMNITQLNAWCKTTPPDTFSPNSQLTPQTTSDCATAGHWNTFFAWLVLIGVVCLTSASWKAYKQFKAMKAQTPVPTAPVGPEATVRMSVVPDDQDKPKPPKMDIL